jgi:hypothetical protein
MMPPGGSLVFHFVKLEAHHLWLIYYLIPQKGRKGNEYQ